MAKMIPTRIDSKGISAAERRVFSLLKSDPKTKNWIVLHSLGISRRETGPYGEIDFVVIIPGEGIICLEVKGGRVSCEDGVWRTMDRHGNVAMLKKSPMIQARDSMFALRAAIVLHFGRGSLTAKCPIGCGVVFPDVSCPPLTPEFERTDVIDFNDIRAPISKSVMRIVRHRLREFQPQTGGPVPAVSEVNAVKNYLRPDFELIVTRGVSVGRIEKKLLRLTEEQYARLDELEANPRCLFEGAAGTGKTLLALEYARRANLTGFKVLLVCFNRLLGEWLQEQTKGTGIIAGTWHGIVKHLILRSSVANEFLEKENETLRTGNTRALFSEIYSFYGEIALEELGMPFDVLVVDEAQDLCSQDVLNVVNLIIPGGLAGGNWAIFGDFTRQALYDGREEPVTAISRYSEHFVKARLTLNCRNTRRIAEETMLIAGFKKSPFRLGTEIGLPVEHRYWKTFVDLEGLLRSVIERLVKERVCIDDVVILSPRHLQNSSLTGVKRISRFTLVDISRSSAKVQDSIKYSTIHSFKGLETSVVIIVDIDEVDTDEAQSLLYVAMSRARSLLILLINEHARNSFERRIKESIKLELLDGQVS